MVNIPRGFSEPSLLDKYLTTDIFHSISRDYYFKLHVHAFKCYRCSTLVRGISYDFFPPKSSCFYLTGYIFLSSSHQLREFTGSYIVLSILMLVFFFGVKVNLLMFVCICIRDQIIKDECWDPIYWLHPIKSLGKFVNHLSNPGYLEPLLFFVQWCQCETELQSSGPRQWYLCFSSLKKKYKYI